MHHSTTLITSMSTEITHGDWWKNLTNPVSLCQPLTFRPIDRCTTILASLFISIQMKNCTMLCCACRRLNGHHTY